jgi:hypothetical protein
MMAVGPNAAVAMRDVEFAVYNKGQLGVITPRHVVTAPVEAATAEAELAALGEQGRFLTLPGGTLVNLDCVTSAKVKMGFSFKTFGFTEPERLVVSLGYREAEFPMTPVEIQTAMAAFLAQEGFADYNGIAVNFRAVEKIFLTSSRGFGDEKDIYVDTDGLSNDEARRRGGDAPALDRLVEKFDFMLTRAPDSRINYNTITGVRYRNGSMYFDQDQGGFISYSYTMTPTQFRQFGDSLLALSGKTAGSPAAPPGRKMEPAR